MGASCSAPNSIEEPRVAPTAEPLRFAPPKPQKESVFATDFKFADSEWEEIKTVVNQMNVDKKVLKEISEFEKNWDETLQPECDEWAANMQILFDKQAREYRGEAELVTKSVSVEKSLIVRSGPIYEGVWNGHPRIQVPIQHTVVNTNGCIGATIKNEYAEQVQVYGINHFSWDGQGFYFWPVQHEHEWDDAKMEKYREIFQVGQSFFVSYSESVTEEKNEEESALEEQLNIEPIYEEPEQEEPIYGDAPENDLNESTEPKNVDSELVKQANETITLLSGKGKTASVKKELNEWAINVKSWRDAYTHDPHQEHLHNLKESIQNAKIMYGQILKVYVPKDDALDAIDTSHMFVDDKFPPSKFKIDSHAAVRRPCQLHKNACFSPNDEFDIRDIDQGGLGDCYFISSLAGLSCKPHLLKRIILEKDEKKGKYVFQFYKNGTTPTQVVIDDLLPIGIDGQCVGARSNIENHFWVPLFEKAFAKFHYGYINIGMGGRESIALQEMLGGEKLDTKVSSYKGPNAVFKYLKSCNSTAVICCSTSGAALGSETKGGIVTGHAYSVMQAAEVQIPEDEKTYRLIQVRNPWGQPEKWRGLYCDESKNWTQGLIQALHVEWMQDAEGMFWMTPEEFCKEFENLSGITIPK